MTDNKVQTDAGDNPRIAVRLELDLLEEAARSRVEQVLEAALNEELSRDPCGFRTPPWKTDNSEPICMGMIPKPEDPLERHTSKSDEPVQT